MATRMTVKGQVTIPKAVRDAAGLAPGDLVEIVNDRGAVRIVRSSREAEYRARIAKLRGSLNLGMSVDAYMDIARGDR